MSITDQYFMYHTIYELVKYEKYEMIHINGKRNEAMVMKQHNRQTIIIRFIQKQFDWKNHLQKDIAIVWRRIHAMKRIIRTKKVHIFNVYLAEKEPIDAIELLRNRIISKDHKQMSMNMYYIADTNNLEEKKRFMHDLNEGSFTFDIADIAVLQYKVDMYKQYLQTQIHEKNKEMKQVFTYGKPLLTYIFIFINLIVFTLLEINGGSTDAALLIQYGAKYNEAIINGEWWRLFTAAFLHIGVLHFIMNMIALYYLGQFIERIYGSKSFFIIYFLSLLIASVMSFSLNDAVSAGASGAIFGLFGALLYFYMKYRQLFLRTIGTNIMMVLLFNLILGVMIPQIDMSAHIGGLIGGFLAAMMTTLPYKKSGRLQIISFVVYVLLFTSLYLYGLQILT